MIITGVAERVPERLARLAYFDADVPVDGERPQPFDIRIDDNETRLARSFGRRSVGGANLFGAELGVITVVAPDPSDRAWLLPKLVQQPLATYTKPIRLGNPAAATVPRVFILCTEGKGDAEEDPVVRTANRVRETSGLAIPRACGHPHGAHQLAARDGRNAAFAEPWPNLTRRNALSVDGSPHPGGQDVVGLGTALAEVDAWFCAALVSRVL